MVVVVGLRSALGTVALHTNFIKCKSDNSCDNTCAIQADNILLMDLEPTWSQ